MPGWGRQERTLWAPGMERALEWTLWAHGTVQALERTLWAHGMERALERTLWAHGTEQRSNAPICLTDVKERPCWTHVCWLSHGAGEGHRGAPTYSKYT